MRVQEKHTMGLNHAPGKLIIMAVIFAATLLLSNIMAVKQINIGMLITPIGIMAYPITFVIMDTVVEVWGKAIAKKLIIGGLLANILATIVLQLSTMIPSAEVFSFHEEFTIILAGVPRIALASLISYYISQMIDVTIFSKLKDKMNGKRLWIRNNVSTMASQLADSVLFIGIAFAGVVPTKVLFIMMGSQYLIKFILAVLDTPFVYMAVAWAKKP